MRPLPYWPIRRPSATAFRRPFPPRIRRPARRDRQHDRQHNRCAPITIGGISATSFQAQPAGSRVPEIVGNLRLDQPWGAVQLSAAAHQVRASLFASLCPYHAANRTYAFPALTSNSYGFAVQGGVQLNADYLSPGDKLWLQAAYEKGAFGYIAGNNLAYSYGSVNQNRFPGSGVTPLDYGDGWNPQINSDCVFTGSGACEQQWGWDITGAYKHYWLPILSSAVYGSYLEVHYPGQCAGRLWRRGRRLEPQGRRGSAPISFGPRSRASISAPSSCMCI